MVGPFDKKPGFPMAGVFGGNPEFFNLLCWGLLGFSTARSFGGRFSGFSIAWLGPLARPIGGAPGLKKTLCLGSLALWAAQVFSCWLGFIGGAAGLQIF